MAVANSKRTISIWVDGNSGVTGKVDVVGLAVGVGVVVEVGVGVADGFAS